MQFIKNRYVASLVLILVLLFIFYFFSSRNLPKVSPQLSGTGSLTVNEDEVIINLTECKSDIRLIDVDRNPTIIEVVEKSFDVCQINYGEATHKRNLIQPLNKRCLVPWEGMSQLRLPIYGKIRLDLSPIEKYCNAEQESS